MKRKVYYVAPRTDCMRVAVEGSFASSVVQETTENGVTTSGQEIGIDKEFGTVGDDAWNNGEGWN